MFSTYRLTFLSDVSFPSLVPHAALQSFHSRGSPVPQQAGFSLEADTTFIKKSRLQVGFQENWCSESSN